MNPYHVTFIDVMSACFHSSLVDDGWRYFNLMTQCYHITPEWRIVVAWLTFFKLYNKCCYPKLRKVSWWFDGMLPSVLHQAHQTVLTLQWKLHIPKWKDGYGEVLSTCNERYTLCQVFLWRNFLFSGETISKMWSNIWMNSIVLVTSIMLEMMM